MRFSWFLQNILRNLFVAEEVLDLHIIQSILLRTRILPRNFTSWLDINSINITNMFLSWLSWLDKLLRLSLFKNSISILYDHVVFSFLHTHAWIIVVVFIWVMTWEERVILLLTSTFNTLFKSTIFFTIILTWRILFDLHRFRISMPHIVSRPSLNPRWLIII